MSAMSVLAQFLREVRDNLVCGKGDQMTNNTGMDSCSIHSTAAAGRDGTYSLL